MNQLEDDDEDYVVDDIEDEDEEILADDEEERSDDDDNIDIAIIRENEGNVAIREDGRDEEEGANVPEQEQRQVNENEAANANENLNDEPNREGRQETLFKGINTVGMRVPLQANYDIRALDHLLVLLSRSVRYSNTYEQIMDELRWLKASYRFINLPTTKPALWEVLGRHDENLRYLLFCEKCKDRIGTADEVERVCQCGACGPGLDKSHIATFVHIGLTPQLEDLLKTPNIADSLRFRDTRVKKNEDGVEDIFDGEKYKNLRENGNFLADENNLSLTFWIDGIKLTKSSPATTYPVIFQVNELSPHARKQNMFLAGLWVANSHPPMNSILHPICEELRQLYTTGIRWRKGNEDVISRFIAKVFVADSLARPDVMRMKRFNGRCGCTYCLAEGEMIENTWVYRDGNYQLRTHNSIVNDGISAITNGTPTNGVKGVSSLTLIPEFDMAEDVPVDCAHNTYLGVAKRLVVRWLTDSEEDWYIGDPVSINYIDSKLLKIRPPKRISRTPRSITLYKMWKASEWRNWLLYYALPCLEGVLKPKYLLHLEKLVTAIYILNSDSIRVQELDIAENLLKEFVTEYQNNYFLLNMVYNVHLLTHLVSSVRKWGPLWVYSSLPFESLNRRITDTITSPRHKADQVITRFFMRKFVIVSSRQIEVAAVTRTEISRLFNLPIQHAQGMPPTLYFIGSGKSIERQPAQDEIDLIRAAGHFINPERDIQLFRKACMHGTEFQIYEQKKRKFCNHLVYTLDSRFYVVEKMLYYTYQNEVIAGVIGQLLRNNGVAYRVPHMHRIIHERQEKRFISYKEIRCPSILLPKTENNLSIVPLSNIWETD